MIIEIWSIIKNLKKYWYVRIIYVCCFFVVIVISIIIVIKKEIFLIVIGIVINIDEILSVINGCGYF